VRTVRHLVGALLLVILLLVGVLAFALYDPLAGGPRFLSPSQLISAPKSATVGPLLGGERPIQQTDSPALAALALRYQPTLVVSGYDRFWPVSVLSLLGTRWHGRGPCVYVGGRCRVPDPTAAAFSGAGSRSDYLQFPAPADNVHDSFLSSAQDLGVSAAAVSSWPGRLTAIDPFATAQIYFYNLPKTPRGAYRGLPQGLISLEYWFYYPLNYFPLVRIPLEALSNPISSTIGNTDYHQGDLEHVAVLLDPKTMRPRYLWMARHADEGQAYPWHSGSLQWNGDHATVYAALGSHTSYAHCGIQRRSRTYWFINDYVVCLPHRTYAFTYSATPLVDLADTTWGCWRGHLGEAGSRLLQGSVGFVPLETPAPVSPLFQQENFGIACRVAPGTPKPAPQL
jgi:hypothetical protein